MFSIKKIFLVMTAIFYLVTIGTCISIPEEFILNVVLVIVSACMTLLTIYLNHEQFKDFYSSVKFRHLLNNGISFILIFFIIALVNYFLFKNTVQWDFSTGRVHTLSQETKDVLSNFKGNILIKNFSVRKDSVAINALLVLFQNIYSEITIENVDIEYHPEQAKLYNIQKSGTLLLSYNDKKEYVFNVNELNISNAFIRLLRERDPVVYFATGHGEMDLTSNDNEGGSYLKQLLVSSALNIKTFEITADVAWPQTIRNLVIWGPKIDFNQQEMSQLQSFLQAGGHLIISLDPLFQDQYLKNLRAGLKKYGMEIKNNFVIDKSSHVDGSNGSIPLVVTYDKSHVVSMSFTGHIFFPLASVIEIGGKQVHSLAQSEKFPYSWGESSSDDFFNDNLKYDAKSDTKGPLTMVAAYEKKLSVKSGAIKILAFSNSTFVSNTYKKFADHFLFLINGIHWQAGSSILSFNQPLFKNEIVFISRAQLGIVFYVCVITLPLLLLMMSLFIYKKNSSSL